jgi:hypothetical protein
MPATILPASRNEDRQLDFVTEPRSTGRLTADLRLEEPDVERIRIVLDGSSTAPDASGADDLLDQRDVVEVRPVRPDLPPGSRPR